VAVVDFKVLRVHGCTTVQAVSRRFSTAVDRVRAQVRSCGICGGQSGTGAGFPKSFDFPYPFSFLRLLHTLHNLLSSAGITGGIAAGVPSGLKSHPTTN
jgi:hypothetical protein